MEFSDADFQEFKQEAFDLLDDAEKSLLAMSKGESLKKHFDPIFRAFHSVKGAAGMMSLDVLQAHMHELESFFTTVKDENSLPADVIDRLLQGCDGARRILNGETIEKPAPKEAPVSQSALNEFFSEAKEILQRTESSLNSAEKDMAKGLDVDAFYRDIHTIKGSSALFGYRSLAELTHCLETRMEKLRAGEESLSQGLLDILFKCLVVMEELLKSPDASHIDLEYLKVVLNEQSFSRTEEIKIVPQEIPMSEPVQVAPEAIKESAQPVASAEAEANQTLRVSVGVLDRLMTLIGEMVLVRNQVIQYTNKHDDLEFINLSQRLDVVTSEVQGEVMKTRMQPIGTILNKFQRVVRDVSKDLGKKIDLAFEGTDTELDKALLEAVKDPLMHIVRNACDHGLETPADRLKAGKSETGNLLIRSYHEGGQVIIEIADDGKGLSREKLAQKAVEKGLVTAEKVANMSEKDIQGFIFAAGFSTAAAVTNLSGRGVGMDVVKKNIEKIGGMVELESTYGKGTKLRLKIPLTLAIVPAMVVRCGEGKFAIPQVKLVELVLLEKDKTGARLETLQGRPVFRLRGKLLPIIDLDEVLSGKPREKARNEDEMTNIVVVNGEGMTFGVIVDEVLDTADIVVKPLNKLLKSLSLYSGATVLGDGSISLILDIGGISQMQHLTADGINEEQTKKVKVATNSDMNEFLLVGACSEAKHAIPLAMVQRMEEFDANLVEVSGDVNVIRYRDSILPIVSISKALGYKEKSGVVKDKISVIVTRLGTRSVGVEVEEIFDVITTDATINDSVHDRPGIMGNIVHNDEVVVVVDTLRAMDAFPFLRANNEKRANSKKRSGAKILFAEDTDFFRRHVGQLLQKNGYDVLTAENGKQALSFLQASEGSGEFDLLLSDIEMPEMNGMQLAKAVRAESRFKELPMIALTTRFNDVSVKEGKEAGFNRYLEKLNPENLLEEISKILASEDKRRVA
ncbi:MAG: chemotaxis protein CheW [Bacteriovoracaceae bacterium]|nr:chemotaxis protein CheW [Bacteriovoracaceae bacterium]